MELKDLFLSPIYISFMYLVAFRLRDKYFKDDPVRKYIVPGMTVKIIGAIAAGLIYFFYYGAGDTLIYFGRSTLMSHLVTVNPSVGFKLIFANTSQWDPEIAHLLDGLRAYDTSSYMVARVGAIFSLLTFQTYTGIALGFALVSFTGSLMLLKTFTELYPRLYKEMAIAILFVPSVFFWGSGLFKDTLSFAFLGWLTYGSYLLLIKRERYFKAAIIMGIALYMLFVIKTYILLSFLPAIFLWMFMTYRSKIRNVGLRRISLPFVLAISLGLGFFAISQLGEQSEKWSLGQIEKRAQDMQWWHTAVVDIYGDEGGGSYYSLGGTDFSLTGMIQKIPLAINVTLFRPYLWEVHNIVMLMASIEGMVLLFFTLKIFFKSGFKKVFNIIWSNPVVFFSLAFALVFAFGVGFTSYNFGALVRYKIPCIPFYIVSLYLIYHHARQGAVLPQQVAPKAEEESHAPRPEDYLRTDIKRWSQSL